MHVNKKNAYSKGAEGQGDMAREGWGEKSEHFNDWMERADTNEKNQEGGRNRGIKVNVEKDEAWHATQSMR